MTIHHKTCDDSDLEMSDKFFITGSPFLFLTEHNFDSLLIFLKRLILFHNLHVHMCNVTNY